MLALPSRTILLAVLVWLAASGTTACSSERAATTPSSVASPAQSAAATGATESNATRTETSAVTDTPTPSHVRRCRLNDLWFVPSPGNSASGRTIFGPLIGNASDTPCVLQGYPTITLFDAAGRAIPFQRADPFTPSRDSPPAILLSPGLGTPTAYHHRTGQAALTFTNPSPELCGDDGSPEVASATIGVPGDPASIPFGTIWGLPYLCQGEIAFGPFVPVG